MKHTIFEGAAVAVVTPLNEKGVDFDALGKIVDFHLNNKTDAIVVCGTTGEAPTLEDNEHLDTIEYVVNKVNKKLPVIAGTGSNNTAHAVMMNKESEKRGADGFLWVTPYYNKSTQRGLYEHYKALAASSSLPGILYNVPSRTGVNLIPETIAKLSEIDNIVAGKEASGNVKQTIEILKLCGDKIICAASSDSGFSMLFVLKKSAGTSLSTAAISKIF